MLIISLVTTSALGRATGWCRWARSLTSTLAPSLDGRLSRRLRAEIDALTGPQRQFAGLITDHAGDAFFVCRSIRSNIYAILPKEYRAFQSLALHVTVAKELNALGVPMTGRQLVVTDVLPGHTL